MSKLLWVVLFAACASPSATAASPPERSSEVTRGAYVVALGGCAACHGQDLSGGMEAPFGKGVWRAPNLTPAALGRWSDEQIIDAVRDGVRADGTSLATIMPYAFYHRMTDADARALVAYLRARPSVHKEVARSEGLVVEQALPPAPGNVDPIGDPRGHGEYLATLMHCQGCHGKDGGGMTISVGGGTIIAPNITSDRDGGIGAWSEAQIIGAVRAMRDDAGKPLHPPMALHQASWAKLTDADAHALAVFVRSLPPVHHDYPITRR